MQMKILQSMPGWNPMHGGPFFSVGNLSKALVRAGEHVTLLTGEYPHMLSQDPPDGVELRTIKGRLLPFIRQTYIPNASQQVDLALEECRPDVIHDNGLWLTLNHKVARAATEHGIPRILSPRGTLDPWALQYRSWKKRIALSLYQRRDLEAVDCFHAASPLEAESIRQCGLTQPIAIIPNGVDIPAESARFNEDGERVALFMGRMHPVKNLPTLLRAWARVKPAGWRLRLVGSDEVGHKQELEALSRKLGISGNVDILDPVYGEGKEALFLDAQLFFLVSKSENFGISAAEALAHGVPVVASRATPWSCLEESGSGWWVDGEVEPLAEVIERATSKSIAEMKEMGLNGLHFVRARLSWSFIADEFRQVYEWMNHGGAPPLCISID
jgi:glycosyltransferase involved in cell wall biosynthesis